MTLRFSTPCARRAFHAAVLLAVAFGASACGGQQSGPASPAEAPGSSAADAPNAAPAANDTERAGRASIFVVHLMSDFDAFKKYFEEGAAERAKAGVKGYLLSKLDDGRVVIHFFADEAAVVEDAMRAPEMQAYLDRKGAPETSLVWVTRDVLVKAPPAPPAGETYSLYLKLKVGDFAALERGFRERHPVFAEQGVIAEGLHRSTVSDSIAIVHFVGTAKDKLEALPKRKEFVELLALAKNTDEVKPLIGKDVARDRPNP
jgi:hypothetical protein